MKRADEDGLPNYAMSRPAAHRGRDAAAAHDAAAVPAAAGTTGDTEAMTRVAGRLSGDRGPILVQVASALVAFTMLSAFVIDYGVLVISRGQAQAAADAAALAG